ncbi:MAG: hypothetical protein RL329_3174 [Bacteroidota bacterium]|jgi:hypothetical protein
MSKPLRNQLEGLFQAMSAEHEQRESFTMPDKLKDAVFSTLDATSLLADIVDLFTVKLIQCQSELIDAVPDSTYGSDTAEKNHLFDYILSQRQNSKPHNPN